MSIEKLLSIASISIATEAVPTMPTMCQSLGRRNSASFNALAMMLSVKNGFYAFEGALHVRPWISIPINENVVGLQAWNEGTLWRDWFQSETNGLFFFGEDIFGGQFALRGEEVVSFEPETGDIEVIASSLEEWAAEILLNYVRLTGYSVAHSWQLKNGPISVGRRLLPKIPFVLGGEYEDGNLYAVDAVKGMRYRGELWEQLRSLPDGAQVRLKVLPLQ